MHCKSQGQVVPSFGWTYPDSTIAGSDSSLYQQLLCPAGTAIQNECAFVAFDVEEPRNVIVLERESKSTDSCCERSVAPEAQSLPVPRFTVRTLRFITDISPGGTNAQTRHLRQRFVIIRQGSPRRDRRGCSGLPTTPCRSSPDTSAVPFCSRRPCRTRRSSARCRSRASGPASADQ